MRRAETAAGRPDDVPPTAEPDESCLAKTGFCGVRCSRRLVASRRPTAGGVAAGAFPCGISGSATVARPRR